MKSVMKFTERCIQIEVMDEEAREAVSELYPTHSNRKKTVFQTTIRKAPEALFLLKGIKHENIAKAPTKIQDYYISEIRKRELMRDLLENGPKRSCKVNDYLTLFDHQQLGREIAEIRDRFAFFYDTRVGKTPLSLTIINDDIQKNPDHKWLVICPLILIENAWLADARSFFPDLKVVNLHSSSRPKRAEKLKQEGNLYIVNSESFARYRLNIQTKNFAGAFVDESSSMKNHMSLTSKAIVEFSKVVDRFYLLSGTPAPNGLWEYYAQLQAVDFYGIHQSYNQFKNYYFNNVSLSVQYDKLVIKPDKQEELDNLIRQYALYVDKEDVLTTPGRAFRQVTFDLPSDLQEHYNLMKHKLYVDITSEESSTQILAPSTAAKLNKLNQITSGFVIDTNAVKQNVFNEEQSQTVHLLSTYRFEKLYSMLEEIGDEQVIIWCCYRHEFEVIKAALGDTCRCVYGGMSIEDKNESLRLFKEGKAQYLIANPASADKGLTLTNCHVVIYFSLTWSYELFKQSSERIYGDVSKQPKFCEYYIMIADRTIDQILYTEVLQGKQDASYAVLNHLKAGGI